MSKLPKMRHITFVHSNYTEGQGLNEMMLTIPNSKGHV